MPEDTPAQKLGMQIRIARVRSRLTQRQLAERIHVSQDKISQFELGRSLPDFLEMCAITGVTKSNLADFGISNEDNRKTD